jgi:hypothetical protein
MPNVSRGLRSPIRFFITSFALALLGMMGCSLHENHDANDPSTLPANRYAGKSCDEILTAIGDEALSNLVAPKGPWVVDCAIYDYRSIGIDSTHFTCSNNQEETIGCSHGMMWSGSRDGASYPSGVYDMHCRFQFPDGSQTKQTSRFGMISSKDCPDTNPGIADDTQAPGPMP